MMILWMIAQATPEISGIKYNLCLNKERIGFSGMGLLKPDVMTQFFGGRHGNRMVSVLQGTVQETAGGTV
jgi:hypothetical protein